MPESRILTQAQALVDTICACIADIPDLGECEQCFSRDDLCCNPIIGWSDALDAVCTSVFVNFLGSQPSESSNECINLTDLIFEVGVNLCVPEITSVRNVVDDFNEFTQCIMLLSDEIFRCLNALTCCENANSGDIISVSGIQINNSLSNDANDIAQFFMHVTVRL